MAIFIIFAMNFDSKIDAQNKFLPLKLVQTDSCNQITNIGMQ